MSTESKREIRCRIDAALKLAEGADKAERLWSPEEALEALIPLLRAAKEWC